MERISLYYRNATAEAAGAEHGVGEKELKDLAPHVRQVHARAAAERKAGRRPARDLPHDEEMSDAVRREVEHFRDRCEVLIVIGGCRVAAAASVALHEALNPPTYNLMSDRVRPGPQLFVLGGGAAADPDALKAVVELVTPKAKKTVLHVVATPASKETAEAVAQFALFRDLLLAKVGKKYKDNVLATVERATPGDDCGGRCAGALGSMAAAEGYRTLAVPAGPSACGAGLGALSAAALFGAGMCGVDTDALLEGAADMDKRLKDPDVHRNPAALLAALHYLLAAKGRGSSVVSPFGASLGALADWCRHVWPGPTATAGTGRDHGAARARALAAGGADDQVVTFLEVERFAQKLAIPASLKEVEAGAYLAGSNFQSLVHAAKLAAEHASLEARRPTITVTFPHVSEHTVGQFLYLYEAAVAYLGGLYDLAGPAGDPRTAPGARDAVYALMGRPGHADLAKRVRAAAKRDERFVI